MKKYILVAILSFISVTTFGQYTLEQCQSLAAKNYPLVKQRDLINKSLEYTIANANRAYLPQTSLTLKASMQSAVIGIPIPPTLLNIEPIPKDQYQAILELQQTIWDGGMIRSSKKSARSAALVQQKQLDSDLYALKERVNSIFFGILLCDEQLKLSAIFDEELLRNTEKIKSYISSGVASNSDLDAVNVEIITNSQRTAELTTTRQAYYEMLQALTGEKIISIITPENSSIDLATNNRPELELFDAQIAHTEQQRRMISSKNAPKIGLFIQGAYGNPGLNMLKAGFTPYAIGGINLSWNFGGYYTQRGDYAKLKNQKMTIQSLRETFLLNSQLSVSSGNAEIKKLQQLLSDDDKIVTLRGNIKRSSQAKVDGGTMSVHDMLKDVAAENSAMQTRALHKIELLFSTYKLKNIINQ